MLQVRFPIGQIALLVRSGAWIWTQLSLITQQILCEVIFDSLEKLTIYSVPWSLRFIEYQGHIPLLNYLNFAFNRCVCVCLCVSINCAWMDLWRTEGFSYPQFWTFLWISIIIFHGHSLYTSISTLINITFIPSTFIYFKF